MIVINLLGGIGNQLFECALGLYLANKWNTELKLDISVFNYNAKTKPGTVEARTYESNFALDNFNINAEVIDSSNLRLSPEENVVYFRDKSLTVVKEKTSNFMPEILDTPDDSFILGYWQSYQYFEEVADIVREAFVFTGKLHKTSEFWKSKIEAEECPVALHLRRTSYMRPQFRGHAGILPIEYYKACIEELKNHVKNFKVFVFSSDLTWARVNLDLGVPMEFVEGCETDVEEFYLMTLCKHNIIANSTYSWWGAWLNSNPAKLVFAPEPWHRDGWGGGTVIPAEWIKIPANYTDIEPIISFIVYIEKNSQNLDEFFTCIFNQLFIYYEVIIITVDGDASGIECRKYSLRTNVLILNVNRDTPKEAAWNLGLKCARGEYVLFLTSKNILSPTTSMLPGDCWDFFSLDYMKRDNYLNFKNYDKISSNVIFANRYMEENPNGNFTLNGMGENIDQKRFSLVSENFSNTTDKFFRLNILNLEENAIMFSLKGSDFIGSKIFRRKFLIENNIKFNPDSYNAETLSESGVKPLALAMGI